MKGWIRYILENAVHAWWKSLPLDTQINVYKKSIKRGGDMMEISSATKECPVGKVESKTAELKAISADALELAIGVESFLLGQSPEAVSEKADKKPPNGWLEAHWEDLDNIKGTLCLVINCLRAVKAMAK